MSRTETNELVSADVDAAVPDHFSGRRYMLKALSDELVGPHAIGPELDVAEIRKGNIPESIRTDGPYVQKESKEEILCLEPPGLRYGVGVLYPWGVAKEVDGDDGNPADPVIETTQSMLSPGQVNEPKVLESAGKKSVEKVIERAGSSGGTTEGEEFDLSGANERRPNSLAVSFLAKPDSDSRMRVRASGGRYKMLEFTAPNGRRRIWWLRRPITIEALFDPKQLKEETRKLLKPISVESEGAGSLDLRVEVFSRPTDIVDERLITVCLINRTTEGLGNNERSMFQAAFDVSFDKDGLTDCILPYPRADLTRPDEEEQSLDLLYRDFETFAIGHGCAADWEKSDAKRAANCVHAVPLPSHETPSITPDIKRADGSKLEIQMAPLAGLVAGDDGRGSLNEIVESYDAWISEKQIEAEKCEDRFREAATRHVDLCRRSLQRIREGLNFLDQDEFAATAFRLANEAILIQQIRSTRGARTVTIEDGTIVFDTPAIDIDLVAGASGRGSWRPFQIAFLLMSLRSSVVGDDVDRDTVDLIWFPTGGGKTEAYFGLAAFSAFYRRLRDPDDSGVQILMRYTLRLLTAQQFQRAAGLICAMENIRRRERQYQGQEPFSIGIWLGGDTTPNSRKIALDTLRQLHKGDQYAVNKLLLTKCPWCSAQIGPLIFRKKPPKGAVRVIGYHNDGKTVAFQCSDTSCEFVDGLPIYVIDDDIYERRPTLVIGTVDKFAMLAWRPQARALFGLDENGDRVVSPPGLIIQDELHLISGPLGSMTGLYEGVIEDLCTDHRGHKSTKPKIVCSTATIRQFKDQARALFARTNTELFPAPGISVADSYFASYARSEDGTLAPGRTFVGVYAPALGSIQTAEVRTFTTLLQAPLSLAPNERDPWWTLLAFFNSLREIGTAATLFQSDIPDRLKILRRRFGIDFKDLRRLYEVMELTSRLRSDEVPMAINSLEIMGDGQPKPGSYPVDACLASSIIEVGVDIDRLSLLTIVGQPKSTSQYIQVAGRVGRRWYERPGLVVTVLGPNSPRDRSHYEKFRSYHERLYAQVEPTSVTPFSAPVLDRALHAAMVAFVRQYGDSHVSASPLTVPDEKLENLKQILEARVLLIDPDELETFRAKFEQRVNEWRSWQRTEWDTRQASGDVGLLTAAGSYLPAEDWRFTWATPLSMRNVDAECRAEITRSYLEQVQGGDNV